MPYWALKTLWHERLAALASAAGVALAMLLVLYLDAVFRGEADQIVAFVERTPGEIWVLQSGIENLHMTRSRLSEQTIADVRWATDQAGAKLVPVVYRDALIGPEGAQRPAYVVGVAETDPVTAWELAAGTGRPRPGQAVVPGSLAAQLGLGLGNTIRIGSGSFEIAGLSRGTFSMANPLVFLHESDARDILNIAAGASLLIVRGRFDNGRLAEAIRAASEDVEVLPRGTLIASDRRISLEMAGELLQLMSLIGLVVSALVVTFSAYAFVALRERELAMARSLGATPAGLVAAVLAMSLGLALVGIALAAVLVPVINMMLKLYVPEVAVRFSPLTLIRLAAAIAAVAALAALVPALRVTRVDPTLVFQA
jgi:ABC-type lipoprotein release transport system permease subunit